MKKFLSLLALSSTLLAFAACGGEDGNDGDAPYRIMVTGGLSSSGPAQANSQTSILSAKAAVKEINADGGLDGRPIELTVVDDAGDPTKALTKLREAIASGEKPDAYLTSGPSTIIQAVLPILKQNKILSFDQMGNNDLIDPDEHPYNFETAPLVSSFVDALAAYIDEQGYKSVAILHSSSPNGELYGAEMKERLPDAGVKVVGSETFDSAALDMTAQLETLKDKDPDALFLDGYGAPVGYILAGIKKLDWDIPIIGDGPVASSGITSTNPPDGLLGTDDMKNLKFIVMRSTQFQAADERVNSAVATMAGIEDIQASLMLAFPYDSPYLIRAAVESAGTSTDPDALVKALEKPEVTADADTAIIANYGFTSKSHAPNVTPDEFSVVTPSLIHNGQFGNPAAM